MGAPPSHEPGRRSVAGPGGDAWMTSAAAVARLGVRPETLYAYVSRGVVRSERIPGTRRSRYRRADIERLAAKQRRGGGRAGGLEVILETDVTLIDPAGSLSYRGWDVADIVARRIPFEQAASWLWTGDRSTVGFEAPEPLAEAGRRVADALADQPMLDRVRAVVAAARHADPWRDDRRAVAVAMTGRALIATVVHALPVVEGAAEAPTGAPLARRLLARLSRQPARPELVRLLDAALVLVADHELAASTLAARVTASTWADPYLVVLSALAALGGPLHGGASSGARELIREVATENVAAAEAVGRRLGEGQLVPGFGHRIYETRDPRLDILLAELTQAGHPLQAERALIAAMRQRGLPPPNVDFALAALVEWCDMVDEAGELIFALARTVGWLAHAAEEYQHRLRFRPRAVYTGPPPLTRGPN